MAENKQYITHLLENGSVIISEDVIGTIVSYAISEVEGVADLSTKPGVDITELLGKKNWGKGMKIAVSDENEVTIDCNVVVAYGQSVVTVATAVQESIRGAVQSMTNVEIGAVNVNVCGIVRQ